MKSKLAEVLKAKGKELKLYQKFESLVRFCEEEVFPFSAVPLQRHIEELESLVESLFPEPIDRRNEMFSGEVFVLLCTLYFHDIGAVERFGWTSNGDILNTIESPHRTLFLNNEIARRLEIPEKAMELVNSLVFSIRKIPLEWEITEGTRKAIVRNGRVLGEIFNFAHLMWDIFSPDSGHTALRRFHDPDLRLSFGNASVDVDSKEGIVAITCRPRVPYEGHVLRRTQGHVEAIFRRFAETVNGRLGFQYRRIEWDVGDDMGSFLPSSSPGLPPFAALAGTPGPGWEEASQVLDKLFRYGHVIVVGNAGSGKTTLIDTFVLPQLRHMSPNVFFSEIWDSPVLQIREAIEGAEKTPPGGAVDIISTCKKLLSVGPCFFVVDGCEKLKGVAEEEKEKFERFIDFCIGNENAFLIAIGDKDEFFDWFRPFRRTSLSAVHELKSAARGNDQGEEAVRGEKGQEEGIDECVKAATAEGDLKEVVAVLAGGDARLLRRYTKADIFSETCIPPERIDRALRLLLEKGAVRKQTAFGSSFYALASRHVRERFMETIDFDGFKEKRRVRQILKDARAEGRSLTAESLDAIEALRDRMAFTREEMGLIVVSAVRLGRDGADFVDKAERESRGFDGESLLALLSQENREVRERAVRALIRANDEGTINPLLAHLRKEKDPGLRALLVDGLIGLDRRKLIAALMMTLTEIGDKQGKAEV
ncbi:MAG TPA: HEAT repeat domain-containing protein, partial [Syntrophorhabdales bacterium]|nr:HEAT repeat domain-containing protein [Syntrophorhabdales bacterium]